MKLSFDLKFLEEQVSPTFLFFRAFEGCKGCFIWYKHTNYDPIPNTTLEAIMKLRKIRCLLFFTKTSIEICKQFQLKFVLLFNL